MKLALKLKRIRRKLDLTQDQMAERLGMVSRARRSRISEWESGDREPDRWYLLRYADLARIDVRVLVDDDIGLKL